MPRKAIIVGAGVESLAAAVRLQADGWDVEVRERAPAPHDTGTSLGLWHGALRAVDTIGLYDLAAPLPRYVSGRVALVGDAAHAMTPTRQGPVRRWSTVSSSPANSPLTPPRAEDALAAYDGARRPPTQRLAHAARLMSRAVHTPLRVASARNAAMRLFLALGRPPARCGARCRGVAGVVVSRGVSAG